MKDKIKVIWFALGLIWISAISLNCLNIKTMQKIKLLREGAEYSRTDDQFLKYNSEGISGISEKKESLFRTAESIKLGLLSVEDLLNALAARYDLSRIEIEGHEDQEDNGTVPISIFFKGSLNRAVQYISSLQKDYPFMPIGRIKMSVDEAVGQTEFHLTLNCRFKIS